MDLWIRSQYKEMLFKVNNSLIIRHNDTTNGMYFIECDKQKIAMYKTRERALEVLDEIQGRISKNECLKNMMPKVTDIRGHEEQFGQLFKDVIYEMPEE